METRQRFTSLPVSKSRTNKSYAAIFVDNVLQVYYICIQITWFYYCYYYRNFCRRDRMVVGFTTTYAINAYRH